MAKNRTETETEQPAVNEIEGDAGDTPIEEIEQSVEQQLRDLEIGLSKLYARVDALIDMVAEMGEVQGELQDAEHQRRPAPDTRALDAALEFLLSQSIACHDAVQKALAGTLPQDAEGVQKAMDLLDRYQGNHPAKAHATVIINALNERS